MFNQTGLVTFEDKLEEKNMYLDKRTGLILPYAALIGRYFRDGDLEHKPRYITYLIQVIEINCSNPDHKMALCKTTESQAGCRVPCVFVGSCTYGSGNRCYRIENILKDMAPVPKLEGMMRFWEFDGKTK
jgi:hypothetical protein